jgi:hypothetical protein
MLNWFKKKNEIGHTDGNVIMGGNMKPRGLEALTEQPTKSCTHEWILWKMTEDAKGPIANLFCGECGRMKKQNLTNG